MNFGGRDQQQRFAFPGEMHHGGGGHWIFAALQIALLLLVAATLAWVVLQNRGGRTGRPATAPAGDGALDELRMRYARGEVTREEFLAAEADLRGLPPTA